MSVAIHDTRSQASSGCGDPFGIPMIVPPTWPDAVHVDAGVGHRERRGHVRSRSGRVTHEVLGGPPLAVERHRDAAGLEVAARAPLITLAGDEPLQVVAP